MTSDLQAILGSKRLYRQRIAARPIAEKLQMLDALRNRALLLLPESSSVLREEPAFYFAGKSPKPMTETTQKELGSTLEHGGRTPECKRLDVRQL